MQVEEEDDIMQQQQQQQSGVATPSTPLSAAAPSLGAVTGTATGTGIGSSSTPIRIGSAKQHTGGGDSLVPPPLGNIGAIASSSHSVPGTPQQQPQSSSVPTATGSHLQLQTLQSGPLSMAASNQSLGGGSGVGAGSSISGINITPPNSAGLRQSSGEFRGSSSTQLVTRLEHVKCFSMSYCVVVVISLFVPVSSSSSLDSLPLTFGFVLISYVCMYVNISVAKVFEEN